MRSQHTAKRPYKGSQPSIASYFPPAISPTNTTPHTYSISPQSPQEARSASLAPLPAAVQSNLLSVGMRVRKSVPEGYKTGSYSAFKLFSDAPAAPVQEEKTPQTTTPNRTRPRARELTPFCGLLDIGGLSQSRRDTLTSTDSEMEEDEDYLPALTQESTISNDSVSTPGARKRRMDFDDEDEFSEPFEVMKNFDSFYGLGERLMAVPRRKKGQSKGVKVANLGQENMDTDDFGEAEFLEYDPSGEVEMSGV